MTDQAAANTDRELWRERPGDFYADSLLVTINNGIGLNVGGTVIVKPIREWHKEGAKAEKLKEALELIEQKYAAVMRDPPAWVNMTPEQLKWVREAWYGASLIARKALSEP